MPNQLAASGAQPQKPTKFIPLYIGRIFNGLWTNRSPLRDARTTRREEKYFGADGDALIAGSNVEISNRLTLIRRPGNPVFDSNSYTSPNRFQEFPVFNANSEQIKIMVDEANTLSSLYGGVKTTIWNKVSGAGQSFMQNVGNSLYWGDGVSNKKWLQTLNTWASLKALTAGSLGKGSYPFTTTFIIDSNGNLQQLAAYAITTITNVTMSGNTVTLTVGSTTNIAVGQKIICYVNTATFLNGMALTVVTSGGTTVTATSLVSFTYTSAADTGAVSFIRGIPTGNNVTLSAGQPTWSVTVPSSGNNFAGGVTVDNNAIWINHGSPVENWGIAPPSVPSNALVIGTDVIVGNGAGGWQANTFYSSDGVIIDSNGGLQMITTAGKSGGGAPSWQAAGAGVGTTTADGTVIWTKIQTAASLTWASHTFYNVQPAPPALGTYVIGKAVDGTNCLYKLTRAVGMACAGQGTSGKLQASFWQGPGPTTEVGGVILGTTGSIGAPNATSNVIDSLQFNAAWFTEPAPNTQPISNAVINKAGEIVNTTTPFAGATTDYVMAVYGQIYIAQAGTYGFAFKHDDGYFFGIDGGATFVSGTKSNYTQSNTLVKGYPILAGRNTAGSINDNVSISFPQAGTYNIEIDFANGGGGGSDLQTLSVSIGSNIVPMGTDMPPGTASFSSATNAPIWPAWTTSLAPNKPGVKDASLDLATNHVPVSSSWLKWINLGPVTDFVWKANTNFHVAGGITDSNGNIETPFRAGISGSVQPVWKTGINQLTNDNSLSNLIWKNDGGAGAAAPNTITTFNGGWKYVIALANSIDNTVSNASPLSAATGNFVASTGVTFAPGAGLPAVADIDSQCDTVVIFRSTDGLSVPFLIGGAGNPYLTIPLTSYLQVGYVDNTPDISLNSQFQSPIGGQNTAPASGAQNLVYHLNRIFFSVGNTVYWTAGTADTPIGNGVNGVPLLNSDVVPSFVTRLVPVTGGLLVFTISGIYVIPGQGITNNPIQAAQPFLPDIGLLSYNALALNGQTIGLFTTDKQFIILDASAGVIHAGFPIGDQFRSPNPVVGTPSALTNWDASKVYVTWHVQGEDMGWYVGDGTFGWYRLMPAPAPETGHVWSPFANIVGGVKAIQSVETTPGQHNLLLGPVATGSILTRTIGSAQDNGNNYSAYAVVGSIVLAHSGQVAEVLFIATDSIKTGTPLTLGILIDEALPYATMPFDVLKVWSSDPVDLPQSGSLLGQRFYLSDDHTLTALCRHMQIQVNWQAENALSELNTLTVFGGYLQQE